MNSPAILDLISTPHPPRHILVQWPGSPDLKLIRQLQSATASYSQLQSATVSYSELQPQLSGTQPAQRTAMCL